MGLDAEALCAGNRVKSVSCEMRKQRQAHGLKPSVRAEFISHPPPAWGGARNRPAAKR